MFLDGNIGHCWKLFVFIENQFIIDHHSYVHIIQFIERGFPDCTLWGAYPKKISDICTPELTWAYKTQHIPNHTNKNVHLNLWRQIVIEL